MRISIHLLLACLIFGSLFAENNTSNADALKIFLRKSIQPEHRITTMKASICAGLSAACAGVALASAYIITDTLHYQDQDKNLLTYGLFNNEPIPQLKSSTDKKNTLLLASSMSLFSTLIGSYVFMKMAKTTIQKAQDESPHLLTTINKNS